MTDTLDTCVGVFDGVSDLDGEAMELGVPELDGVSDTLREPAALGVADSLALVDCEAVPVLDAVLEQLSVSLKLGVCASDAVTDAVLDTLDDELCEGDACCCCIVPEALGEAEALELADCEFVPVLEAVAGTLRVPLELGVCVGALVSVAVIDAVLDTLGDELCESDAGCVIACDALGVPVGEGDWEEDGVPDDDPVAVTDGLADMLELADELAGGCPRATTAQSTIITPRGIPELHRGSVQYRQLKRSLEFDAIASTSGLSRPSPSTAETYDSRTWQ